ncbi:MAG: class I SAM-dependent rRNA methyltransferase [Hyphomicrobiales bacterium]|nr:class I SAM-dependent rRNA methyltransferase [Hyphomicrobiales bacterium]MCP4999179.1 class I SAM-dependent rRNA methyltransferase [Hyphomicrobiales bacterium]
MRYPRRQKRTELLKEKHLRKPQRKKQRSNVRPGSPSDSHTPARRTQKPPSKHAAGSPHQTKSANSSAPARPPRQGKRPAENTPVILETAACEGFRLIDSGNGEKLEQYGPYRIIRPEAQALWPRALGEAEWASASAIFTGDTDEDGMGRWKFPSEQLGQTWPMRLLDIDFYGRFTSFRHVGVFPEQLAHWRWMQDKIRAGDRTLKVLNLFGYTGVASLIAAAAGAEVTHVDASKKAIGWARENQSLAGIEDKPIRWICDDAMKFIAREERRGNGYDIILTDPPKFGRGPNGEVWQLFDHLPAMLDICRSILSPDPVALVLTAYSIRASFYSIHELMRETMRGAGGVVESGELLLREQSAGRALSTSLFSRWVSP